MSFFPRVNWGTSGLATLGFRIVSVADGSEAEAFNDTDVAEDGATGVYVATVDDAYRSAAYAIQWSDAGALPVAEESLGAYAIMRGTDSALLSADARLDNLDAAVSSVGGRPEGWVSITPATLDTSNVALGVAQVSGVDTAGVVVAALLDGLAKNVTTSDGDGDYDLPVPPGATYTVRFSWDGPDGAASADRVVTV